MHGPNSKITQRKKTKFFRNSGQAKKVSQISHFCEERNREENSDRQKSVDFRLSGRPPLFVVRMLCNGIMGSNAISFDGMVGERAIHVLDISGCSTGSIERNIEIPENPRQAYFSF